MQYHDYVCRLNDEKSLATFKYVWDRVEEGLKNVPEHMHEGVRGYLYLGRPNGHFLTAVHENNLMEAASRADDFNQRRLFQWAQLLYNAYPIGSFGSKDAVKTWMQIGGLIGSIGGER